MIDRDDELSPSHPVLAPEPPAVDRICTCRCDGRVLSPRDLCACPDGMECRELVASSRVNGAASEFVGSYCTY